MGQLVPFEDEVITGMTDWARVRKIYKLGGMGGGGGKGGAGKGKGGVGDGKRGGGYGGGSELGEEERREMEMLILGAMALRGATN